MTSAPKAFLKEMGFVKFKLLIRSSWIASLMTVEGLKSPGVRILAGENTVGLEHAKDITFLFGDH